MAIEPKEKKVKEKREAHPFSIRMRPSVRKKLDKLASKLNRTRVEIIELLIEQEFEEQKPQK